jgi:hypothetical protein
MEAQFLVGAADLGLGVHRTDQLVATVDFPVFPILMMHKRYLLWLLVLCGLTLLPAIALNLLLLKHEGDIQSMSYAASDWQQQTRGITYTPSLGANALFKTLRLNDRLAETDTVIFGSSTGMPIDSTMLPKGWHLYNFTQRASPLSASIAQAEYLVAHEPQIKHYIIALDWSIDWLIGSVYHAAIIIPADLSRPQHDPSAAAKNAPSLLAMLQEAISYPRMEKLWDILGHIAKSPYPQKTFREYFLQLGSDEYTCPDGKTLGKDFGVYHRGSCNGFRYDGSATYSDYSRVDNVNRLIISALNLGTTYARSLQHTHGAIDPGQFEHLAALSQAIARNGGTLMLYMPPLVPGLENAFLNHPKFSADLLRTKRELAAWASGKSVFIADFGQSEKFGCTPAEFLDEHHADGSCYQKVFSVFWQNDAVLNKTTRVTPDARK